MIHFHGTPLSGSFSVAARVLLSRFAFVSFADPAQFDLVKEHCSGFALDNGAFSFWKRGKKVDWELYRSWVFNNFRHPGYCFAICPDVIEGSEADNDDLLKHYGLPEGVPVFHQGESWGRLERLIKTYPRIALGSVEKYIPSDSFHEWMIEAMKVLCDEEGKPKVKIHGLRMLNPDVFQKYPLSSADSTNIAQNYNNSNRWGGTYNPVSADMRGLVLRDRIEAFQSAASFEAPNMQQLNFFST